MSKPPKVVIPGLNRGAGIPPGYTLGRRRGTGKGPAELLDLAQMKGTGLATTAQVTQVVDQLSTAISISAAAQTGAALMLNSQADGDEQPSCFQPLNDFIRYIDGGGPYAWPAGSARVAYPRFIMENPDGSFVGMGGTAAAGSQMFGAIDPAFTHWWNFAQISDGKYLIDGDLPYNFTLDAYVGVNKIYHGGNLSFGAGLTYNVGTGVLTASGGAGSIGPIGPMGMDGLDGDDGMPIPGPAGASGAAASGALTKIASQVLSVSAASISFTSIPSTYSDLLIVLTGAGDKAALFTEVRARLNNDSGANYDWQSLTSNNTTDTSGGAVAQDHIFAGWVPAATGVANAASTSEITIADYAGTTFQKECHTKGGLRTGTAVGNMFLHTGWNDWRNTAAVNRVDVFPDSGNFIAGTKCVLYGRG